MYVPAGVPIARATDILISEFGYGQLYPYQVRKPKVFCDLFSSKMLLVPDKTVYPGSLTNYEFLTTVAPKLVGEYVSLRFNCFLQLNRIIENLPSTSPEDFAGLVYADGSAPVGSFISYICITSNQSTFK